MYIIKCPEIIGNDFFSFYFETDKHVPLKESGKGKSENKGTQIIRLSSFLIQGCDVWLINVLFILIIIR
jgi:hypothetical protein